MENLYQRLLKVGETRMNKVFIGIVCCLAGIVLIHQNRWGIGLLLFIVGFTLMMTGKRF